MSADAGEIDMSVIERAVVITGVSSGIGEAAARLAVRNGAHVFGSVRRLDAAATLQAELGGLFTPLLFDVRDEAAVGAAASQVRAAMGGRRLFGLVNNAGVAVPGPLEHLPVADFREQLEVNLVAPLIVTQAFLPLLGADPDSTGAPGRIVNVSSVAGKQGAPFLGAYAAAKHGLEGMTESLRRELAIYGIDVIIVAPGAVATPIWEKAEQVEFAQLENTVYAPALHKFRAYALKSGRAGYPPETLATAIWTALTTAKPRTRYAVVINRLTNWTIPRLLPRRVVDRIITGQLGLRPTPTK
jgi:NAD(P)-dependent dehydrogenase (short-subunit alcohol dehydrogenase family)